MIQELRLAVRASLGQVEPGSLEPGKFLLKLSIVNPLGFSLLSILGFSTPFQHLIPEKLSPLFLFALWYFLIVIEAYVSAFVFFLFLRVLKVKCEFNQAFKAIIFGSSPFFLLGWVPWVSGVVALYSTFYLVPKTASSLGIQFKKALLAILMPIFLTTLVLIALVLSNTLKVMG